MIQTKLRTNKGLVGNHEEDEHEDNPVDNQDPEVSYIENVNYLKL